MPGEHSRGMPSEYYKNEQHKRAMKAPIKKPDLDLEQRAREAGL